MTSGFDEPRPLVSSTLGFIHDGKQRKAKKVDAQADSHVTKTSQWGLRLGKVLRFGHVRCHLQLVYARTMDGSQAETKAFWAYLLA